MILFIQGRSSNGAEPQTARAPCIETTELTTHKIDDGNDHADDDHGPTQH